MQEITIILGSLAGIATAVAISRRPKTRLQSLGASSQIREQITSLKIERDILTKTISRLYENDESFSKIQKDKLLSRYQHQLGVILARIEKLEQASEHPDLGPVGDGRWLICYQDDASRFVTGHDMFEHATTENALAVLEAAIKKHGKPASILTDRGTQFYANAAEKKKKGISKFEQRLAELEISHIVARPRHPQTNGKIERLFGELERKLFTL